MASISHHNFVLQFKSYFFPIRCTIIIVLFSQYVFCIQKIQYLLNWDAFDSEILINWCVLQWRHFTKKASSKNSPQKNQQYWAWISVLIFVESNASRLFILWKKAGIDLMTMKRFHLKGKSFQRSVFVEWSTLYVPFTMQIFNGNI